MQTQSSVSELEEQLSAYFDDELDEATRAAIEADIEADPELAARLLDLSFMRTLVVGNLDHQAERVPEARFEQLWDSFEDTLGRESRLQEAAEAPPGLIQRVLDWIRPVRVPLAALAAVGALAFIVARSVGAPSDSDEPTLAENTQASGASEATEASTPTESEAARPSKDPVIQAPSANPSKPRIAVAPTGDPAPASNEVFPQPEPGEAEIRRIEFGGQMGTISQVEGTRGTTTVIWVTEDEDPVDSERSL
jgi:anti-sigma factor RsiW